MIRVYFNMVCVLSQVDPPRTYTDRYSVLFMRKQGKAVPRVREREGTGTNHKVGTCFHRVSTDQK